MAFGKKKQDDATPDEAIEADAEAPVNLFDEEADEDPTDAPTEGDAEGEAPVETAEPVAADPLGGGDALLSLFQESETTTSDRAATLELAGDVEMSDLIDDLRTVAVALRIDIRG